MPPTPSRPGPASGVNSPAVRPTVNGPHSMSAILSNIEGLFTTARQGRLNAKSMIYLRGAIHQHYRYLVFSAVKNGKPNPLLDIPHALNPSVGPSALVDPGTWLSMVTSAEVEAKQKLAEGSLVAPKFAPVAGSTGTSTPGSSPGASGSVRPPPAGVTRQQQPLRATGSIAPSQAGSSAPSPTASTVSQMSGGRHVLPGTIMKGDELRKWANMPSAERAAAMRQEPELKRRFEASVVWYRAQSKAKELAQENAAAQASASGVGGTQAKTEPGSSQQSEVVKSTPTASAPASGIDANPTNPPSLNPTFDNPNSIPGNPNFTLSQPPSRNNPTAGPSASVLPGPSNIVGPISGHNTTFDPSTINYTPSPLPQSQTSAPIPPPPPVRRVPDEPEGDRRKRKYKEWVGELGAGLELEMGLEEIFNDVVEKFVNDVVRSGARLAKHRKSDKVEVKDLAFYIDKQFNMTVPGFDAVLPRRTHIPADDEDKRRLRAVIPRNVLVRAEDGAQGTAAGEPAVKENGGGSGA